MGGLVEQLFLRWVRPAAPALCMGVYGVVELVRPETPAERILVPLGLSVVAGIGYRVLHPRVGTRRVLQALVVVDTILIAGMTVALEAPDVLAIAYFWSIALAAFFLGHRETLVATAVAAICAAVVPFTGDYDSQPIVVVTDVLVLSLIGSLLALLARHARAADGALLAASQLDASVLRIAEQVRASLDPEVVLDAAVEEIGRATRSTRGLCRVVGGSGRLHQWTRDGAAPVEVEGLPPTVARVVQSGESLVVGMPSPGLPVDVLEYMQAYGTQALIAVPIIRQGDVVAVLGVHDDKPRRWGSEVTLVERVAPQIAAALAQAEAYAKERRVAQLREELIANVSHELRTPLTATIGFLQTLRRTDVELDAFERAEFLEIALDQAARLARLVEDLLTLSGAQGGPAPAAVRVDIRSVVGRAARELNFDGRELHVEVPDGLAASAEDDRLVQVFSNLLGNALLHGQGAITVVGRRAGSSVEVAVADEGPELPEGLREEVFIPFARWNANARGSGLGLPISRTIVERFGGTLVYEDGAFVVSLPEA